MLWCNIYQWCNYIEEYIWLHGYTQVVVKSCRLYSLWSNFSVNRLWNILWLPNCLWKWAVGKGGYTQTRTHASHFKIHFCIYITINIHTYYCLQDNFCLQTRALIRIPRFIISPFVFKYLRSLWDQVRCSILPWISFLEYTHNTWWCNASCSMLPMHRSCAYKWVDDVIRSTPVCLEAKIAL